MKPTALLLSVLTLFGSCHGAVADAKRLRELVKVPPLDDLEPWLERREAQIPDLKPEARAGIVWANPEKKTQTRISVIYLPGYTATRGEIAPVPDRIAQALGANLYYSRPTGQGVGPLGHKTVTAEDWMRDGLEAFEIGTRLGSQVVLIATSTGATVATWMVLGPPGIAPAATILVSPNLTPKNKKSELLLGPWAEALLWLMVGDRVTVEARNDLQARFWDTEHHSHSLIPMMQLVDRARRLDFTQWNSPALVVYDPKDEVVDEEVTVRLFSKASSRWVTLHRWTALEGDAHHVLAGDAVSPGGTQPLVAIGTEFLLKALKASPQEDSNGD